MSNAVPLDDLIGRAIEGVKTVQSKSKEERAEWLKSQPFPPPSIPLRNRGVCLITEDGLRALHEFGRRWREEDATRRNRIDAETAEQLAARVFGDMIDGEALKDMPPDTDAKRAFKALLEANLDAASHEIEYYFSCRLFDDEHVPPFEIGPVCFRKRGEWLEGVAVRADPTKTPWTGHVGAYWAGKAALPDKELTAKAVAEEFISNWVAIVRVSRRTRRNAQETAEVAVRIAIDTLGLLLQASMAANLRGPGDEIRARLKRVFSQMKGRDISYSSLLDMPRLAQRPGDYAAFISDTKPLRDAAGKAIATLLELPPTTRLPNLYLRWVEAMHWFGEARRETVPRIALFKIGITLDVLAQGKRAKGILDLCCDLFDMRSNDTATSTGKDLKWLVDTIYNDGRSQIAHGGHLFLQADLPISRQDADYVAAASLERYIRFLDVYTGADDYVSFINAIPALRPSIL